MSRHAGGGWVAVEAEIESLVGQSVAGKYKLVRVLGTGGMGAVYEAVNTWTDRRVALKLMLGVHSQNHEQVERFLREARAAGRIEHPNIVQVLDVGQCEDGAFFLVQEFLSGQDLRALLAARIRLSPREARALMVPVMSALGAAHALGVVHRDIKPENIFMVQSPTGERVPKVIDFGIAKLTEAENSELTVTRTGIVIGTPLYMSPEQARGARNVGAQSDVWSLGVVLFECLAGRCPFDGESYNEVMALLLTQRAPRLDDLAPETPHAVADVVAKALEPDTSRRYRTMDAFAEAVRSCTAFDSEQVASASASPTVRGDAPTVLARETTATRSPSSTTVAERVTAELDDGATRAPAANSNLGGASPDSSGIPASDHAVESVTRSPAGPRPLATSSGLEVFQSTAAVMVESRGTARRMKPGVAWIAAAGIAAGAVAVRALTSSARSAAAGGGMAHVTTAPTRIESVTPRIAERPADVPHLAQPATLRAAGDYAVAITVSPATTLIELDGARAGVGAVARTMHRDGTTHTLRLTANGYAARDLSFTDASPPEHVTLEPLRRGNASPTTLNAHLPTSPLSPAATGRSAPPGRLHGPMDPDYE